MFCPNCGNQQPNTATFCSMCGTNMAANQVARRAPNPAPVYGSASFAPQRQPMPQPRMAVAPLTPAVAAPMGYPQQVMAPAPYQQKPVQRMMSQQRPAQPVVEQPRPIKTNRSVIVLVLLSILTFGIYGYYFIYKTAQDMNVMCQRDNDNTGGLAFFILLNILTLGLYSVYWWYKITNRAYLNAPAYGVSLQTQGSTFLIFFLLGVFTFGIFAIVGLHKALQNVNQLAMAYNRQHGFLYA